MPGTIDARLKQLGIELPQAPKPAANYVPFVTVGTLVFCAGQVPVWNGEVRYKGRLGEGFDVDDGYQAARLCGLNLIAQAKAAAGGDLDRVKRVVKLGGFVSCSASFTDHPKVLNGASDLMAEVFGDNGKHARFAVGAPSLPLGFAVEVDGIFELS